MQGKLWKSNQPNLSMTVHVKIKKIVIWCYQSVIQYDFFKTNYFYQFLKNNIFLEAQLLCNYINVTHTFTHGTFLYFFHIYVVCGSIYVDVLYGFAT